MECFEKLERDQCRGVDARETGQGGEKAAIEASGSTMRERWIDRAVGRLRLSEVPGSRATLVLWPGLFFDQRQHEALAALLVARGFGVVHVNPPAYGGSTLEPGLTMEACGDALLQVVESLALQEAWVGGTSWGGAAGIFAALRGDRRIAGVLAFNTPLAAGAPSGSMRWIPALTQLPPALFALGAAPVLLGPRRRKALRASIAQSMRSADRRSVKRAAEFVLHERSSLLERLPELRVPALVLCGSDDALYPPASLREAWRLTPSAEVIEIAQTGHSSALEDPPAVADVVESFLLRQIELRSR